MGKLSCRAAAQLLRSCDGATVGEGDAGEYGDETHGSGGVAGDEGGGAAVEAGAWV